MPFRQTPTTHTPYVIIAFDKQGAERTDDPDGLQGLMSARILNELKESTPTDIFVFSHGWMGDVGSAIFQYDRWIDSLMSLSTDIAKMGTGFHPVRIGLHWPSKPWGDETLPTVGAGPSFSVSASAPPDLLETYLDKLDLQDSLRARELMGILFREASVNAAATSLPPEIVAAYTELAAMIGYQSTGAGSAPDSDNAPFDAQAAFQSMNSLGTSFDVSSSGAQGILTGILGPLGQLSFWTMKKRARTVGEGGMYQLISQAQQIAPRARVHLVGHSFGCIVVSSIIGGPKGSTPLPRAIDSLMLLQGAVSMWAYADKIPSTGGAGYFNAFVRRNAVRGPIVTTRSSHDTAVGSWYPAAVSMVLQDPSFALNPALVVWGGIGAFGIQGIQSAKDQLMLGATGDYGFSSGNIYNLDGSQFIAKMEGASGAHSDVYEPEVMHALWQSVYTTTMPAVVAAPLAMSAGAMSAAVGSTTTVPSSPAPPPIQPASTAVVVPRQAPLTDADMPIPFGVHAQSGSYLSAIRPADLNRVRRDSTSTSARSGPAFAIAAELDANDLSQAGWGIVFPAKADPTQKAAIQNALQPLLDLRKSQAGDLFKVFDGPAGYQAGLEAEQWLNARGSGMFPVVPQNGVPYYLTLVGSPDDIPFNFQYGLSLFYAAGRVSFRTPDEYARYAQNIVDFEKSAALQNKTFAFFNTRNSGDRATALLHDQVALPLLQGALGFKPLGQNQGYSATPRLADDATKSALLDILRGKAEGGAPALLFTGSHGVDFMGDPNQLDKQGAILTQDWVGGPITQDSYFAGDDVPADAKTQGMIHFLFACYGAACPQFDTYSFSGQQPVQIANSTFMARLPQKLLLSGMQAVIGHVDRAWGYSFQSGSGQAMSQGFRDPLVSLLQGNRVGHAMDTFNQRWAALDASLSLLLDNHQAGVASDASLANRWVARDDARNYIILGDPAARLRTQ